ncbi:MAG: hypothetical protein SynsKO_01780 [Synoicihabitans sp.]
MSDSSSPSSPKPKLWVPGDWNAFFGYGTNILVNLLTMTGLLMFVLEFPNELIFGRILPAVGLMLFISTGVYGWMAYNMMKQTGRNDVCAMPSGPGVGHMFIGTLVVMLPIKLQTGDPIKAWEAGLCWVFLQSIVLFTGSFFGDWIRRVTPRAALLATLTGIAVAYISMRPVLQMFQLPIIGLTCFAVIAVSWFGGVKFPRGIPAGLVALLGGTAVAWGSNLFGLNYGGMNLSNLAASFTHFGFSIPLPAIGHTFSGFEYLGLLIVTAIPFGIYDLVEALDNVESASVAGDKFSTRRVLLTDGTASMIGCLMGNPYNLAVYIGHPGWKAMGGRCGYAFATGIMALVLCWLGIISVLLALIPVVAILPILLYIGMLIGSQAFQETPIRHAPAVILGLLPHLSHWAEGLIRNSLAAAGVNEVTPEMAEAMAGKGVLLEAMTVFGNGSALAGIVLAAVGVFIIDRKLWRASAFAAVGAGLTFIGMMHGKYVGIGQNMELAASYLLVALFLAGCAKFAPPTPLPDDAETHHG